MKNYNVRPMVVALLFISFLLLVGHSQAQKGDYQQEPKVSRIEKIAVAPGTPRVQLTSQEGDFLFAQIFPAGERIAANSSIQSEPINVGGASHFVIRMVADAASRNLEYGIFFGPMPDSMFYVVNPDEVGDFQRDRGLNIELPVRAESVVLLLRNTSNDARFLNAGATIYAER
jgi:hypothetical protein